MKTMLVTGSSGLIGSETADFFGRRGWRIHGIDNNMRSAFFGPDGDTSKNRARLEEARIDYHHHDVDIRDRTAITSIVKETRPSAIVHCAGQPSHELAANHPIEDFDINAVGTLGLLQSARDYCPESPFVFMSSNKVYGDAPNEKPFVELDTRFDYFKPEDEDGISEDCRIDASVHSIFGVSKAAGDLLVQEYGRYFGMPTVCFRAGCVTGPNHAGTEMHGFLAYLARCFREGREYLIYGHNGKQVRDNIHSSDVCRAFEFFIERPTPAAIYNLGGGRENSISIREAIHRFSLLFQRKIGIRQMDQSRRGDHICYITNTGRFRRDYPGWCIKVSLDEIFQQLLS